MSAQAYLVCSLKFCGHIFGLPHAQFGLQKGAIGDEAVDRAAASMDGEFAVVAEIIETTFGITVFGGDTKKLPQLPQ